MQNYEKSASVARMLGVDPALAKIAINTAKSSFSSLMPLSMRKVVINSILDMGLSTLALLAKTGYVLGDVRVKLVQRLVESKGSLPLIFPKEDIDFDYSTVISPTVSSSDHKTEVKSDNQVTSSSLVDRMFGSGGRTDKEVTLPILRQGGRIPHCWFFSPLSSSSSSSNGKISSHMTDVTCNGTTPIELEDRMSGLGNDQSIFSSVSLSAFNHASQMASTAYKGNPRSAFSSPKVSSCFVLALIMPVT